VRSVSVRLARVLRPLRRSIPAALAVASCALPAAGCGSSSQSDHARTVVKDFLSAAAKGDGAKACAQLTADAKKLLESATSASCERVIRELGSRTPASQRAQVDQIDPKVSIHGSTATATYHGVTDGRQERTITLQQVGGQWKISQLPSSG
jgi:hypothetical protein